MLLFSFSFSSIDPRYELLVNQNIHYCKKKRHIANILGLYSRKCCDFSIEGHHHRGGLLTMNRNKLASRRVEPPKAILQLRLSTFSWIVFFKDLVKFIPGASKTLVMACGKSVVLIHCKAQNRLYGFELAAGMRRRIRQAYDCID